MTFQERMEKAKRFKESRKASKRGVEISTRELVRQDKLTEDELKMLSYIYPQWSGDSVDYKEGDIVAYKKNLYEVIQDHTSQSDWTPDTASSLFTSRMPEGVIPEWEQPEGSHDAYNEGDKVIYDGEVYKSLNDGNVHSPSDNPSGWEKQD